MAPATNDEMVPGGLYAADGAVAVLPTEYVELGELLIAGQP